MKYFEGSCVSGHGGWSVGQPAEDEGPACQPAADADHRLGDVHPVLAGVFKIHSLHKILVTLLPMYAHLGGVKCVSAIRHRMWL